MRTGLAITTAICALAGFAGAQQQTNNSNTIFQLLNQTDGSSPSFQIMQFLQSSPDYQSIIDILNDPNNNVTLFIPSDQVYYNITGQQPPAPTTNSTAPPVANNGTMAGNSTTNPVSNITSSASAIIAPTSTTQQQQQPTSGVQQQPSGGQQQQPTGGQQQQPTGGQQQQPQPSGNGGQSDFTATFEFSDFLSQILPSPTSAPAAAAPIQARYVKLPLSEEDNTEGTQRFVLNEPYDGNLVMRALKGIKDSGASLLRRQQQSQNDSETVDSLTTNPYYKEFSTLDLMYYHLVNGSVTLDNNVTVLNSLLTNSTVNKFGSGSPLLVQPDTNGTTLTVGDGTGNDASINQTIQAGNGIIYVINKVLVPPVNTTETISELQNATTFNQLLQQSNSTAEALNSATNFTLFVPTNSALQNFSTSNFDNQTLSNVFKAHVFPGVYYSTNLTSDEDVTIQSSAGTNVTLHKDPNTGAITVNGTNVVQSNILTNNGVVHLIDSILGFPTVEAPGANPSENPGGVGPFPAPTNMPSSSVITAAIPNLVSAGVMLSTTFVAYFIFA